MRSAAGSPSRPAAGSAAGGPACPKGSCPRTVGAPAARRWLCQRAGWPGSPWWRPAGSAGPPSIPPASCPGGGLHQNREALLLERRARLGAAQEVEERLGIGVLRILGERRRVDDRRMRVFGKAGDDLDVGLGSGVGAVDDAERRLAAR